MLFFKGSDILKKFIFLIISLFTFGAVVYANDIKSINMDIYVDNYGNAHVTEIWDAKLTEGTEGYKPYYNLGESYITNYKVKLNNQEYTYVDNWDINASFNEKKYLNGINYIDNGIELCFGISNYGNNTYTLSYTINNFVANLSDSQMIYWQLIPYELSDKPEKIYIKVYSDFKYSDDTPVWGYGYGDKNNEGYAYVYDGYIEMSKEGSLDSDEYVVLLAKFPENTFETSNSINKDFDDVLDEAEEGATVYHKKTNTFFGILGLFFMAFINLLPFLIFAIVIGIFISQPKYGTKRLKFNKGAKDLKDAPYFRDIPCNKDVFKAYWVACNYNLIKKNTDFLGTILLKWLKNNNIENINVSEKEKALKLISSDNLSAIEVELYEMMRIASVDGILEKNEFTKWCKNNYSKILNWFNRVIDVETENFVSNGLIKVENNKYYVQDEMKKHALEMKGLKDFLNDFSNIKDRSAIEVKLWDEYLMYAQIFGIAKKVAKEFKRLYPDVLTDDTYDDIIFIHTISYEGVSAASVAKSRAESYSSGGGGFSSSGGGGGSFGGGGGGGGFR